MCSVNYLVDPVYLSGWLYEYMVQKGVYLLYCHDQEVQKLLLWWKPGRKTDVLTNKVAWVSKQYKKKMRKKHGMRTMQ